MMRNKLVAVEIEGYKSIKNKQILQLKDINILIGANGVGKSNLVSFFQLLNYITSDGLQVYIGKQGYADSILHNGTKETGRFSAKLLFKNEEYGDTMYEFGLVHSYQGQMMFANESVMCKSNTIDTRKQPHPFSLGAGHQESLLTKNLGNKTCKVVYNLLKLCRAYQFNNTSDDSFIRKPSYVGDSSYLRDDAGNLSAFLLGLKDSEFREYYNRIEKRISRIMPQFKEFLLQPLANNPDQIRLDWVDVNGNVFGPKQISDGSIRFIALATLLLQPAHKLPNVVVIDEPELGLHPEAIIDFIGMVKIASQHCQVVLATQSPYLIDCCQLEDLIVVNRDKDMTVVNRLSEDKLKEWLDEYTLSEVWNKNIIGGRP